MFLPGPQQDTARAAAEFRRQIARSQPKPQKPPYGWRWFSGAPLDGAPRTDATWFLSANQSVDPTYRGKFHTRPRIVRAGMRTGATLAPPAVGVAWWVDERLTMAVLCLVFVLISARAGYKMATAIMESRHQRRLVQPLAAVLAPVLETNKGTIIRGMEIPRDYLSDDETVLTVPLLDTWRPDQVSQAVKLIHVRLGGEWNHQTTKEAPYFLRLTHKPAPPNFVSYKEVAHLLRQGSDATPLLGLGVEAAPVRLNFDDEAPHIGMSVGTGGGKSSLMRLLIAQLAYHGVDHFTVIDPKMVSLQGMDAIIPGLTIYDQIMSEWAAIANFRREMDRRYLELRDNPKAKFDRWFLILEEQNAFALESDIVWKEIKEKKDPARPPVWADIAFILVKARQVKMHVVAAYQRMDDRSTGGFGLRDQFGMKLLSRFSPSQWDMLVDTRPRAIPSNVNGRWTSVMGGLHRQVQLPFMTVDDVADLMSYRDTSGVVRPASPETSPEAVPGGGDGPAPQVGGVPGDTGDRGQRPGRERLRLLPPPPEGLDDAVADLVAPEPEERLYTLKEASSDSPVGFLPVKWETAKKRRTRAPEGAFPEGVMSDGAERYTKDQLTEFFGSAEKSEHSG
ncbi:hypothetical protein SAMN05421803_1517 [Nocardiopsis flavescens]|uniref:FtsK/SpoIIIE family protein n=2 Tax=Nocardiopsis flavescens TaxID=758803 RepID=A0A1M6WU29_9ACTN|nr:hypothetical protein SAMN05421803_1517 [Nocardiopsis flavescens]